ncbi:MAG TPA: hypothetical protein VFV00_01345, partial [Acidimicrobiales bacterium]|nr:hypothetical protein [Acidimicrobiales bacterium]
MAGTDDCVPGAGEPGVVEPGVDDAGAEVAEESLPEAVDDESVDGVCAAERWPARSGTPRPDWLELPLGTGVVTMLDV